MDETSPAPESVMVQIGLRDQDGSYMNVTDLSGQPKVFCNLNGVKLHGTFVPDIHCFHLIFTLGVRM